MPRSCFVCATTKLPDSEKVKKRNKDVICPDCRGKISESLKKYPGFSWDQRMHKLRSINKLGKKNVVPFKPKTERYGDWSYVRSGGSSPWKNICESDVLKDAIKFHKILNGRG